MHWLILSAIILLNGCTTIEYRQIPVNVPIDYNVYPKLQPYELECLTDESYKRLVKRDVLKTQRAEDLEAVIKSTWGDQ